MAGREALNRRAMLAATAAGVGTVLGTGCGPRMENETTVVEALANADFYDPAAGTFLSAKARSAYYRMMERFGYPIVEALRGEQFWAIDFGLGDFVHVGMGGIFWWNNQQHSYFGHEIFLLPGQMIVEHAHVETPHAKPKVEAWHVRHGMIWTFGEGPEAVPAGVELPATQAEFITARHGRPLMPGEVRELDRPTARHFMIAGPEGAIVTEYATYHDNAGLRFTNPNVKF